MKVAEKFLRNNFLLLIVGLDVFYIVVFFIVYLLGIEEVLNFNSVLDIAYNNPGFILILIHPLVLAFFMAMNFRVNMRYNQKLESELNMQSVKMEEINTFVEQLRQGNVELEFSQEYLQDKLVRSLLNMKSDIEKTRKEDEIRQIEEKQRHWVNEGLAEFGRILRENQENLDKLASEITSNLTKYLNCQQAGFFVVKEGSSDKFLEMIALFAYDRKKFPDKKFKWGEGLIGAATIEKKTIFLKETSNSFVDITSGLGKANPRAIIIVPIKDNEDIVHGAIELASFKVFEEFEINFIEQVAESIGLTIATIKTSLRTQDLLKESQKQAEMLAQQDETMRRNIEEIEKGREESEQKAVEFELFSNSVNEALIRIDLDLQANIKFVNKNFLELFHYETKESVVGQKFINLIDTKHKTWFNNAFDQILVSGEKLNFGVSMLTSSDMHLWLITSFVPILNSEGELTSIMVLAVDRTEIQEEIKENKQAVDFFTNVAYKADFNTKGEFITASKNFYSLLDFQKEELDNKAVFDLLPEEQIEQFKIIWRNITKGKEYSAEQIFLDNKGNNIITNSMFAPVKGIDDGVVKVSLFATDISELKMTKRHILELENNYQKANAEIEQLNKDIVNQIQKTTQEITKKYQEKELKADIFENLFQNTDQGLVVLEDDNIVFYNKIAEQIWGLKKEVTLGKKSKYLFSKDERTKDDNQYLGNVISQGIEQSMDEKQMYILDRHLNKIEIFAKIIYFENKKSSYLGIFINPIK